MIRHILLIDFSPEAEGRTKAENMKAARRMLEALSDKMDWIRALSVGVNTKGADNTNYDMALTVDFDSLEDLERYRVQPDHVAVAEFLKNVRQGRACVDCEL